uniref:Uncharacterized protein n=1 Tax=Ditylenchus dipsaci TaxID=166011 RepID=A0A915ED46_9BILA
MPEKWEGTTGECLAMPDDRLYHGFTLFLLHEDAAHSVNNRQTSIHSRSPKGGEYATTQMSEFGAPHALVGNGHAAAILVGSNPHNPCIDGGGSTTAHVENKHSSQ